MRAFTTIEQDPDGFYANQARIRAAFAVQAGVISADEQRRWVEALEAEMRAAGFVFEGTLVIGQALRIMTGAPMPAGADTVYPQEIVVRHGDRVAFRARGDAVPPQEGDEVPGRLWALEREPHRGILRVTAERR